MHVIPKSSFLVEAELNGEGDHPWAWAIYGSDPLFVIDRSEPMFETAAAAVRVGRLVAQYRHARAKTRDLQTLH